jgi:tetratricopeptide (TPR) repeat protein
VSSLYYHWGWVEHRQRDGDDGAAIVLAYELAIELDSFLEETERVAAHYHLGAYWDDNGRFSQAISEYEWVTGQTAVTFWGTYWAHLRLGSLCWQMDNDQICAESHFRQAVALEPQNKQAYQQLGLLYEEMGQWVEAQEMYEAVLALDASDKLSLERLIEINGKGR